MKPLRDEAEAVIKEEGWTKAGMRKLRRLDSFMKESLRLNGINCSKYSLCVVACEHDSRAVQRL